MAWTILRLLDAKTFMNANDEIMFLRVYYIFLLHTYIYTPSFSHTHTHTHTLLLILFMHHTSTRAPPHVSHSRAMASPGLRADSYTLEVRQGSWFITL